MAAYCRALDGTRLIHKRQMNVIADMDSDTYPGVDWIIQRAQEKPDRPFILNEYAHAMGNAMGNLQDYWDAIEQYPCLCGAFVWEWFDHGIEAQDAQGNQVFNHGGDYATAVNSGNFCMDGVVTPDRQVTSKLLALKTAHQYIRVRNIDIAAGRVEVLNGYAHIDLSHFRGTWQLVCRNKIITQGEFPPLRTVPGTRETVQLPFTVPANVRGEVFFNTSFVLRETVPWATVGHEVAATQIPLPVMDHKRAASPTPASLRAVEQGDAIVISGGDFAYEFSLQAGAFSRLEYGGRRLITETGPRLQAYRAPTDNDAHSPSNIGETGWIGLGLDRMESQALEAGLVHTPSGGWALKAAMRYHAQKGTGFNHYTIYQIAADGSIALRSLIQPFGPLITLPRMGIRLICDPALEKLRWFGRGPGESYPDRKSAALVGDYRSVVSAQNEHYMCPQEMGGKEDTRFLLLSGEDGVGIHVCGNHLFSFSALHFTAEDLRDTGHDGQLKPRPEVILSIDYRQNGLGNSSCGGDVMEAYRLKPLNAEWDLVFTPYRGTIDPYDLAARDFPALPSLDEIFKLDHTMSAQGASLERREPFDPSDEQERKRAGF
jgi:beta-galactosidase